MNNQYLEIRDQRFGLPSVETDLCVDVVWSCGAGLVLLSCSSILQLRSQAGPSSWKDFLANGN